jgi:hypothetical protein
MADLDDELRRMQRPFKPAYYRADLGPGNQAPANYCATEAVARSVFPSWPTGVTRLTVTEDEAPEITCPVCTQEDCGDPCNLCGNEQRA